MNGLNGRRIVSLFVAVCMLAALLPMPAAVAADAITYEYVGAGLDKEYDGASVSVDLANDIKVDGKTGVLTPANASVGWLDEDDTTLSAAPSDPGQYKMVVYVASSAVLTKFFVIWEIGHEHTLDRWSGKKYDDNEHWTECEECGYRDGAKKHTYKYSQNYSDTTKHNITCSGCDYKRTEPHAPAEFSTTETLHWRACSICTEYYDRAVHTFTIENHDDHDHWKECNVCGYKNGVTAHNLYVLSKDEGTHTLACRDCDYTTTEDHEAKWITDDYNHYKHCDICDSNYDQGVHRFPYYGHEAHWGKCTECGLEITQENGVAHKAIYSPTNDNATHYVNCISCNNVYLGTHDGFHDDTAWIILSDVHYKHCDTCESDYASETHSYTVENHDDISHWTECKDCKNKIGVSSHNYIYTRNNNTTYTVSCSECDYEETKTAETGNLEVIYRKGGRRELVCSFTVLLGGTYTDIDGTTKNADALNGVYGDMEFVNGIAELGPMSPSGVIITALDLPVGITYSVEVDSRANMNFHKTTSTGEIGNILKGETAVAEFVYFYDRESYTVIYDYSENGGTSMTNSNTEDIFYEGDILYTKDIGEGVKPDWIFVGWNTNPNAKKGLESIEIKGDETLYAIYKKEFNVTCAGEKITAEMYNKAVSAVITLPEPPKKEGWEGNGWYDEKGAEYKTGMAKIKSDMAFSPSYKKLITLVYDTNGSSESVKSRSAYVYRRGSDITPASFVLAANPQRSGYTFAGWTLSTGSAKTYNVGDTISLSESAVATAKWQASLAPGEGYAKITYDALTNGGSLNAVSAQLYVKKGESADLESITPQKNGYEFVGWNTDKNAHEALTSFAPKEDTTLYAIFKKDIEAVFYFGEEVTDENRVVVKAEIYNNDTEAYVTEPEAAPIKGWEFDGWRNDKHTIEGEYKDTTITVYDTTCFYAVYSREIIVDGDELTQRRNTGGGIESKTIVLGEPETSYDEDKNERFAGWEVTQTDENGNEITTVHDAGEPVTVSGSAKVKARTIRIPDGATLPTVETVGASIVAETEATLSKKVTGDGIEGNEIIKEGFVYWNKLSGGTKYTLLGDSDTLDITNLSPGTEYYYYAFAENAAGTRKGATKSFTTEPDALPNAIKITPEYISVEKGGEYQLLAVLLPDSTKKSGIVWSSSNEKIASVDQTGKITAVSSGQAIITATTEVGRLTAECIVDVTTAADAEPMDFSEWHMASHTSKYAENGVGFDWDTADMEGGNHIIATAYLARWEGAVDENSDPYPAYDGKTYEHYNTVDKVYHVQDVEWLPIREDYEDNDEIKSALMKYGAVYTLMSIDGDYFDDEEKNYYCPDEIEYGGHTVAIVGWDDNYPRTKFKDTPPGDGAFICKNSWGDWWGEDGYFYVSYYDALLGLTDESAVVTGIESNTAYNTIYQYDPLGAVGSRGYKETTYAANVFPEKGSTLKKDETLHAVSFYTYQKNTSYEVYIVTDYVDSGSLSKLHVSSASGVMENAGYHTVDLKTPIELKSGTRFAVVVRFDTPGEYAYVYYEYPEDDYSSNARANADESYISSNGSDWQDLTEKVKNANFCIKAFTDNGSARLSSAIDNLERHYEDDTVYSLKDKAALMDGETTKALGGIQGIVEAGENTVTFTDGSLFPSRYDLREMGLLSPVKNQGEWGTCWAHSIYASLESSILRSERTTSSENGASFTLSRAYLTMEKGSALTLAKRIRPADLPVKSVVWLSDNENVAIVDTNGTVRAVGYGTATISAALSPGGLVAYCSVVVENDGETEEIIKFEKKRVYKKVGDVFMVGYSITPLKAGGAYTWISDNTNVATVNNNGVITVTEAGTAEVSIMSGGVVKDTVTVVVGDGFNLETGIIDDTDLTVKDGKVSGDVHVRITNNSSSEKFSFVILAAYDNESGAMASVVSQPTLLRLGENIVDFEISFDAIGKEGYTLKYFVWESFGNISTLSKIAEESVEAK